MGKVKYVIQKRYSPSYVGRFPTTKGWHRNLQEFVDKDEAIDACESNRKNSIDMRFRVVKVTEELVTEEGRVQASWEEQLDVYSTYLNQR